MPQRITIGCYNCDHRWSEDLERRQNTRVIYRSADGKPTQGKTPMEEYEFDCPNCGTLNVIDVPKEQ